VKVSAAQFFWSGFVVLFGLLVLSCSGLGTSKNPAGMLLPTATIGGLIGLSVTGLCSRRLNRPFGLVDAVRSAGWTLAGFSMGAHPGNTYYLHFWPQFFGIARMAAIAGVLAGIATVVIASFALPAPQPNKPGLCQGCGYDLTGNTSGTCPECGQRIEPAARSS
jgi:hypothetical protein